MSFSWTDFCYDTIVIGGGVAGLTAAKQLHDSQHNAILLEAKNRLGGRVHTNYDWGFAIELGASWIHGINNNPLLPLVDKHSIVLNSYNNSINTAMLSDFALYTSEGSPVSKQVQNLFSSLTKEFIRYYKSHNRVGSFEQIFSDLTQNKKMKPEQRTILHYALENIFTYEYAENLSKLSPNIFSACETSPVSGKNALLPEGYFQIFQQFSDNIPVNYNQIVHHIDYGQNDVRIVTQSGSYNAKQVIITVPLGVLKSKAIRFNPALPSDKLKAIDQLEMGNYEKLYLLFDKVFWDEDKEWVGMLPKKRDEGFNIFNYYKYSKKPVLIVFTSGKLARKMEKRDLTQWVMQHLRTIYGRDIPNPIETKKTQWRSDPFALGSYSYLPMGVDKGAIASLAKPVEEKLIFAGEATSDTDPSTVHGAYLSGIRAANEVITRRRTERI